jgi:DNA sulfur modification protein DndD
VRLRELMADALPFSLVQDQLRQILSIAQKEEEGARQAVVLAELQRRDQELINLVRGLQMAPEALDKVVGHLAGDRQQREQTAKVEQHLGLSPHGKQQIQALLGGVIAKQVQEAKALNERLDAATAELDDVVLWLARVPADATIAGLSRTRDSAMKAQSAAGQLVATRQLEVTQRKAEFEVTTGRLAKVLTELIEADAASARERRLLAQAQEIRGQLQEFRSAAVQRHTKRIASAVLECFQSLIRKASLLDTLQINAETYEITLFDSRGRVLPPKRMSAGERQLLATSLLWGLSRVSGRALPTVIDTPLGRMDSTHRRNLVERYFPQASHQVILLSTDEEINGGWLAVLEPAIGRTYLLEHDDETRRTAVKAGYFGAASVG